MAQSGRRRIGSRRSKRVWLPPSCSPHPPPGSPALARRVPAGKDEIADAGGAPTGLLLAGTACQIDMLCVSGLKGLCGGFRLRGIDLVRRAQARHRRAGSLEGRGKRCRVGKSHGVERLDAAGLEEAFGERGTRREIGGRAEIGEKDLWPCPSALESGIRLIAQRLEGCG